jgi:hypothetical protein
MLSSEPQRAYAGLLDLRAQAEVPSARKSDTAVPWNTIANHSGLRMSLLHVGIREGYLTTRRDIQ